MKKSFGVLLIAFITATLQLRGADSKSKTDTIVPPEIQNETTYIAPLEYPYRARQNKWHGSGLYEVSIQPNGTVSDVRVIQTTGNGILDRAAQSTLMKWRWRVRAAKRVQKMRVPITFAIGPYR